MLSGDVPKVIAALTTPRAKELDRELRKLRKEGSGDEVLAELAATWGGRVERRYRSITELINNFRIAGEPAPLAASVAAEALAAGGWAERGLEVRCDRCGLRSFVPLALTQAQPACPACGATNQHYTAIRGPEVHYRLNGLLDRASDQGVVPHLIAMATLRSRDPETFILPGVQVTLSSGDSKEVDLFGVHAGLVVAGEVKTSGTEFTEDQVERDLHLSKALGADAHIFAAGNCPEEAVRQATALAQTLEIRLIIIEGTAVTLIDQ